MPVPAFKTLERKHEFFDRLNALLDDFPEFQERMARDYAEDPTSSYWDDAYGDRFDPSSPVYRIGVVVAVGYESLQGWSDISFLEPDPQARATSVGLLTQALRLT